MIQDIIEKIGAREHLSKQEAYDVMSLIMTGKINAAQIAGFLVALKYKGETDQEVAGFAMAMRDKSLKLNHNNGKVIDLCGTGGDHSGTFNISSTASFVTAGAGVKVAKHGNRSISSSSGSADVLTALGIPVNLEPQQSLKALTEIGITFLFAPQYHPAMKHVASVRKELAMKTVFNILGPLTNPAGTKHQLIGVYNDKAAQVMSRAAEYLNMQKVCFVCCDGRYDEVLLEHPTRVIEYSKENGVKTFDIDHETFGYPPIATDQVKGGTPQQNADIMRNIFYKRERSPFYYVTAANAALALYASGFENDLKTCAKAAEEAILKGAAAEKLNRLMAFEA
ncbi:MAG: anthranilate phosphoribosyltransferase [Caldithrix sp.]|nr:anthranilate phosphoribosyltransferase [Caldithrix sp.]